MNITGFHKRISQLQREMPQILQRIVYQLGEELLNHITEEIRDQDLIDTGAMWQSFSQNSEGNLWEFDEDRNTLTLEVGSNIKHARYVNDGYTIDRSYFVPGYWNSAGSFVYDPEARTGFMVRPRTFIGRRYFDIALEGFQGGMRELVERRLQVELERVMR